ncbi:PKD domain-containing protein [Chitinophaga filiformis]|uniref:PKD domain-containing protein n=1 Tax=Chitinophaga filiformis TaxID=104663 RepID=UPI001F2986D7|nr:PKD domain-containing protein [Chitinophaga filiformis]MCF6402675.1 PKD domain-containing protein [Chitinophaga filiformis]MCF6403407.1 PKD domain-containing protein [Chitinophaga filiformis]
MKRSLLLFVLLTLCRFAFGQNGPGAMFVQSHYQSCTAPFTVTFKDSSWSPTRTPLVFWKWEFGDGTVDSSGAIVTHTFLQKGFFRVKLTVRDQLGRVGTYSAHDDQLIRIGAALQLPSTVYICNPSQPVTLRNLATPQWFDSLGTYQWLLDGNVVSTARNWQTSQVGLYQLKYTACDTTLSGSISIADGAITPSVLTPVVWSNDTAKLDFAIMGAPYMPGQVRQVSWDWGDGKNSVAQGLYNSVTHSYTVPGTYNVRATVRLNNPADLVCDSVGTYTVNVRAPYVTHNVWNRMDTLYTGGDKTYLISATNTGATFKWKSMDPNFASSAQILSTWEPGKYWVEISKSGDVITDTINIMPKANFTFMMPSCSQMGSMKFYNGILVPVYDSLLSITWHYGDGKSDVYPKAKYYYEHTYDAPGIYKVVMEACYKSGYNAFAAKDVLIYPLIAWDIKIQDDTVSVPGMHILSAKTVSTANPEKILWYPVGRNLVYKSINDTIQTTVPVGCRAYLMDSCTIQRAADTFRINNQVPIEWTANVAVNYNNCMATLKVNTNARKGSYWVLWNTGATSDSILVTKQGWYGFTLKDSTGNIRKDSANVIISPLDAATLSAHSGYGRDTLIAEPYGPNNQYFFYRNDTLLSNGGNNFFSLYFNPIPGVYKVTVQNTQGCTVTSPPLYFRVPKDSVAVNFIYSADQCISQQIKFIGTAVSSNSQDTVRTVKWNFGDGMTATYPGASNTVSHYYEAAGTYTVTLIATTAAGHTYSVSKQVAVWKVPYNVNIISDTTSLPGTNVLTAVKNPADASVIWSTGSTNDTIHVHTTGYYSVWLKDSCGNVRAADTLQSVINAGWNADAYILKWTACGDTAIVVASTQISGAGSISWSNGQGGSVIRVTTPGVYTVTVRDLNGNIRAEDSVYVELKPFKPGLEAHLSVDPNNDTLIAYPHDSVYYYKWYRNDTSFMSGSSPILNRPTPGVYRVFVTNGAGCTAATDTVHYKVNVPVLPVDFSYEMTGCDPTLVKFIGTADTQDSVTYRWKFGDGSGEVYGLNASHNYAVAGAYNVTLEVTTASGRTGSKTKPLAIQAVDTSIWITHITQQRNQCGDSVLLTAFNNAATAVYSWNTGVQAKTILATASGYYAVSVYDTCGHKRFADSIYVTVNVPCVPQLPTDTVLDFSYKAAPCEPRVIHFKGITDTVDSATYKWNFGDGSGEVSGLDASHYYAVPGAYSVTLKVTRASGRTDSITKPLAIQAVDTSIWITHITQQRNQCGDSVLLTASNGATAAVYSWNNGVQTKAIMVTASGYYAVSVYDTCGYKRAADSIYVTVNTPCVPETPTDTISIGDGPIEGGSALPVTAGFGQDFNADNVFTVQLTLKNPGGRQTGLQPDEVINLGSRPGTGKDITMEVDLPDSLACATSYAVRVVASSPADTTAWSQLFTITNQPPQPVITQRGDSLFTSGKYNWQWYLDNKAIDGATAANYRARKNGVYMVESLNGNGCTSKSAPVSVIITAVGEVTLGGNKVKAFPNPSEGQVSLQFGKPLLKTVTVNVYNLNGRVMYTRTTTQQLQPLDLSGLPKGYYLIELTGYGEKKVLPLILQ